MPNITLYSFVTSPFAAKVHCYLLYKQLDFDVVYVNPLRVKNELPTGHQVPVLSLDDEHVVDSKAIGYRLDNKFNQRSILPKHHEKQIDEFEDWLSHEFIPVIFQMIRPSMISPLKTINAWRLSNCFSKTCPHFPWQAKLLWPLALNKARFIRDPAVRMDSQGSSTENRRRLMMELDNKLSKQAFIAAPDQLSMADLSLFALLVVPYSLGLIKMNDIDSYPNIDSWLLRLKTELVDDNPSYELQPLVPESLLKRPRYLSKHNL